MPGIRHKGSVGGVHNHNKEEEISYCQRCLELANYRSRLKNRIYLPNELGKTVIPEDHDQWLQCHKCGSLYAKYNVKKESELADVVEPLNNPHNFRKGIIMSVGGIRKFDRTGKRQQKRKRQQELDDIKDEDLKRDLQSGYELISYQDNSGSVF